MTDWLTATAMLLSGLIVGFMIMYSMRRKDAAPEKGVERRDLEAKRDALIEELRALDETPENAAERARLEREAASVLRALDGLASVPSSSSTPAVPVAPRKSNEAMKGFAWGVVTVAAIVALGWWVTNQAKDRSTNDSVTGGGPMTSATSTIAPAAAPSDPATQQLEAKVKASPDDVESRIELAKAYLDRENLMGVFEQTQVVLAKNPNEPRALTYQALVRLAMGQTPDAMQMLQNATKSDPSLIDAWVGIAWIDMQSNKPAEAEAAIREAIRRHPEEQGRLSQVLDEMRARANANGVPSAAPPTAPAAETPSVHVTLNLAPNAKVSASGVIFVIARAEGVTAGPPAAVKRLPVGAFPMTVEISAADSMMGQPLPPRMRIEARIDSDGNPLTKDPSDPAAFQDGVAAGTTVNLQLK